MTVIPNQDILSLEMIQKYPKSLNGTTIIKYYIDSNILNLAEELYNINLKSPVNKLFDMYCRQLDDNFNIESEGQFFVKASAYETSEEHRLALQLAKEDDLRFKLYYNKLNSSTCPNMYEGISLIAPDYQSFYQSFVIESMSINALFHRHNPVNKSLGITFLDIVKNSKLKHVNTLSEDVFLEFKNNIENSLKVLFEQNMDVIFTPSSSRESANLIIFPLEVNISKDIKTFKGIEISRMNLIFPYYSEESSTLNKNDYIHGLLHIFLDHPCENYYPCTKGSIQEKTTNIEYLTSMSQLNALDISRINSNKISQLIQSPLPWDLAALRHSYGMPQPKNVTYHLNDSSSLSDAFSVKLLNNTLIALPSIGYNTINATDVLTYNIDLRYDHLSNITNNEISFQFLLSYDTEIAEIFINTPGNIILNKEVKTQIFIPSNQTINYYEAAEECLQNTFEEIDLIRVCNYNESLHHIEAV